MEPQVNRRRRWPISSGLESRHIRALGVLILLLCAWIGLRLYGSSPDRMVDASGPFQLKLDPNNATPAELAALPEIGPAVARAIVEFRSAQQQQGKPRPFTKLADLDRVPGLGPATLQAMESYLVFDPR